MTIGVPFSEFVPPHTCESGVTSSESRTWKRNPLENGPGVANALSSLAVIAVEQGEYRRGAALAEEALADCQEALEIRFRLPHAEGNAPQSPGLGAARDVRFQHVCAHRRPDQTPNCLGLSSPALGAMRCMVIQQRGRRVPMLGLDRSRRLLLSLRHGSANSMHG